MKDLIRRILREQRNEHDTDSMILNYDGDNSKLLELKRKLQLKKPLTDKQREYAVSLLKRQFYNKTIYDDILSSEKLKNIIKNKGKETYNNIIRGSKRDFFRSSSDIKMKIDKPSESWISENIESLKNFLELTPNSTKRFDFPEREGLKLTTHQEAKLLLDQLEKKDFWGFLEKTENGYVWSILNKVDTNYINWAKMISKRNLQGDLKPNQLDDKINFYFKQQPLENFYKSDIEGLDDETKRFVWRVATTMSFAEFDLLESFLSYVSDSEESNAIDRLDNIMDRLKATTKTGDDTERNFVEWLKKNNVPDQDIILFDTYGNLVDVTFQVDMIVKLKGKWVPIQVKSSEQKSKLLQYDIGGIVVYPAPKKYKCGDWAFKDGKSFDKSFDQEFFGVTC